MNSNGNEPREAEFYKAAFFILSILRKKKLNETKQTTNWLGPSGSHISKLISPRSSF